MAVSLFNNFVVQISTSQQDLVHLHRGGPCDIATAFCDPSSHTTERGDRWEKNISCSIFWKMDSGVRYMHTRVGQILRSLFWTFLIHTANVSSFEHAVALKVPYYRPHAPMLWLLSYFELNCPARPSNWPLLCLYSTKNSRLVNIFVPQLWACMLAGVRVCSITSSHSAHTLMASVQNEANTHPGSLDSRLFGTEANKIDFDACASNLPLVPACWTDSPTYF